MGTATRSTLPRILGAASAWGFAFSSFYLLPKFLAQELAASPAEIGAVVGMLGISTVCFTPLAGRWMDRFPRRYALAGGALLMSLSAAGFLGVHAIGPMALALRVVQGLSYALVVTAVGTLVADCVRPERLAHALGLSGASMLIMNAVAPAIVEPLAAIAGWHAVFAVATVAGLVAAVLAGGVREPARASSLDAGAPGLLAVLRQPLALHYAAVVTLAGVAFGTVFTFQQPYALALGRAQVSGFFVAYAVAAIGVRVAFGHLPQQLGCHRVAMAALAVYTLVVLAMAALRPSLLEVYGAIFGAAHGLFYPALNAIAVQAVRPGERGRVIAIFTGSFSLGLWAGATVLGRLVEHAGYPAAFVTAAVGTGVALVVLATSPALRAAGETSGRSVVGGRVAEET